MPKGYHLASEVLPPQVAADVLDILGSSQKVTFGVSGSAFNKSEHLIPEKIVHQIRTYLDGRGILSRRTIWFDKQNQHFGDCNLAEALIDRGFPIKVISVAMGFHKATIARWGLKANKDLAPPVVTINRDDAISMGAARLAVIDPPSLFSTSEDKLALIGQCMAELDSLANKKRKKTKK